MFCWTNNSLSSTQTKVPQNCANKHQKKPDSVPDSVGAHTEPGENLQFVQDPEELPVGAYLENEPSLETAE